MPPQSRSLPSSARDPEEFYEALAKASDEMLARWVLKNMGSRRDDNILFLAAIMREHRRQVVSVASEKLSHNSEIEALRKKQAEAVMPLIGNLLDQWDGMPNDLRDHIHEVHEGFTQAVRDIEDGMEGK